MAIFTIVYKAGLKAWLHTGHHGFVNIALARLTSGAFNINIDQLLTVDNRNPELFGMGCVKQHSLHLHSFAPAWLALPAQ